MELLVTLWNEVFIRPMVNSLVMLYLFLFHNFGLSIIVFTVIVSLVTFPLTLKQIKQTRALSSLNPRLQELRKRYAGDRQGLSQETMRLYREHGVSPLGCLGPMVVQMPVLFGLYYAVVKALPGTPERLAELSGLLYSWLPQTSTALPLSSRFLGMDLALVGGAQGVMGYVLMGLVGVSMWVSMKMTSISSSTDQTQQIMQWMFPVMIGFLSLSFPVGLSVYWVASSIIRILTQGVVLGPRGLLFWKATPAPQKVEEATTKEMGDDGSAGSGSQDRRRGDRDRSQAARRRARRGRDRGR